MTKLLETTAFPKFLVAAKIATYAAADERYKVEPLLPGSHQLEFRQGDLLYRDIYYGGLHFAGVETVFAGEQAIWSMTYYGGFTEGIDPADAGDLGAVLKAALRQVPLEHPFRGPIIYQQADYVYTNEIQGGIAQFSGIEHIYLKARKIYRLLYSGGLIQ